jgi:hypothetical protein
MGRQRGAEGKRFSLRVFKKEVNIMTELDLHVTLWPSFPHFAEFAKDTRLKGIRLNSAMITNPELERELALMKSLDITVPLYFDIKGRQLRVVEVQDDPKVVDHLDLRLNHPISVETPCEVLFKGGGEHASILSRVEEDGRRLIFDGFAPSFVDVGESLHIKHPSLRVHGPVFMETELKKIEQVKKAGFNLFYLSYVRSQYEIDLFFDLVGKDSFVFLKVEDKEGLEFVAREYKKQKNVALITALGDLFVEVDRPHEIMAAARLIIEKDPEALAGSRMLLSTFYSRVPSAADFMMLAWLYDIGYRRMLLCDEICLDGDVLSTAVGAFDEFRKSYVG